VDVIGAVITLQMVLFVAVQLDLLLILETTKLASVSEMI